MPSMPAIVGIAFLVDQVSQFQFHHSLGIVDAVELCAVNTIFELLKLFIHICLIYAL